MLTVAEKTMPGRLKTVKKEKKNFPFENDASALSCHLLW